MHALLGAGAEHAKALTKSLARRFPVPAAHSWGATRASRGRNIGRFLGDLPGHASSPLLAVSRHVSWSRFAILSCLALLLGACHAEPRVQPEPAKKLAKKAGAKAKKAEAPTSNTKASARSKHLACRLPGRRARTSPRL